jgi:hypothetical protein
MMETRKESLAVMKMTMVPIEIGRYFVRKNKKRQLQYTGTVRTNRSIHP